MNKTEFLIKLSKGREQWDKLIAGATTAQLTEPGLDGGQSLKDIIAHITWYEKEALGILQQHALAGSDAWNLPQDQRNMVVYEESKDKSLDEALADARQVYPRLVATIEKLPDQDLNDPSQFAAMPADWEPWQVIAANTFEHYAEHEPSVRAWLDGGSRVAGAE